MNENLTSTRLQTKDVASHNARPIPPIIAWLFPSISDLIFIALLASLSYGLFSTRLLGDADIGWHIRNGQLILQSHSITRIDPFSASMQGHAWYDWEWLYDIGIATIHNWAGLNGVVWVTALLIAFVFALTFRLTLRRGAGLLSALIFLLLGFAASVIHMFARPHLCTWLLAVIWFGLLDSLETSVLVSDANRSYRKLLWLPCTMLLWVNLHGGFLFGFLLLAIYLCSAAVQYIRNAAQRKTASKWLRHLGITSLLSALASLVNPFGYHLYTHIYCYLTDRWLINHIDEFQSPNFHGAAQQCFAILVILSFVTLAITPAKPRFSQWLVILFAVYSGFYAARNLPVSSLLLTILVAPLFSECFRSSSKNQTTLPAITKNLLQRVEVFSERMNVFEWNLRGHLWAVAAVVIGFFICNNGGKLAGRQLMDAQFSSQHFPVQAANFIAQKNIASPIFCPDSWGGYLIYRFYPRNIAYVDDRHDLYGSQFFKNYLKIMQVSPQWHEQLQATGVHWVLLPEGSSLANVLKETKNWKAVYEDHTAVLFGYSAD